MNRWGRLSAAEGKAGIRRKPRLDPHQAEAIDGWLKGVTGKRLDVMSCAELERLENLFRSGGDEPMGDDLAELVRACMDENQTVIDLERRRQTLDRWPSR